MSATQVYIGVSLTLVLAVGCQILGSRLRIPALILLLPAGFLTGWLTDDVNPNNLLGASFQPMVSLCVAVILYDSGLGLHLSKLRGHTRTVVIRLLALGVPLSWALATIVAGPAFGMGHGAALMFGVILVVSGPTVVGPLLGFVRPTARLRRVLIWEGSLIDPVGGLLGALVYHGVSAHSHAGILDQVVQFVVSVAVGALGGALGTVVLWLLLTKLRLGEVLGTAAQLATVVAIAGVCDAARDDSGLISAIVMGLALTNIRTIDMPARRPFFEVLVQLIIGVLFVSISATVTPQSVRHLLGPTLVLVAVLMLVARPLAALLSTLRTDLSRGERVFVGAMAPRGIVAAATASTFSAGLVAQHLPGASKILPGTFLVIVATVTLYGLSAEPVAKRLGVTLPQPTRPLVVGGDPWVIDLAKVLRTAGMNVLMWADSDLERARIREADIDMAPDSLMSDVTDSGATVEGVNAILLLTAETGFNALAATLLAGGDGGHVYRLGTPNDRGAAEVYAGGDVLFGDRLTGDVVDSHYRSGARIALGVVGDAIPLGHELLFRIRRNGRLVPVTSKRTPPPEPGDRVIVFGPVHAASTITRQ